MGQFLFGIIVGLFAGLLTYISIEEKTNKQYFIISSIKIESRNIAVYNLKASMGNGFDLKDSINKYQIGDTLIFTKKWKGN